MYRAKSCSAARATSPLAFLTIRERISVAPGSTMQKQVFGARVTFTVHQRG